MTESRLEVAWGWAGGWEDREGRTTKKHEEAFGNDGYVHYFDCEDFIDLYICKSQSKYTIKNVQCTVHQWYLNRTVKEKKEIQCAKKDTCVGVLLIWNPCPSLSQEDVCFRLENSRAGLVRRWLQTSYTHSGIIPAQMLTKCLLDECMDDKWMYSSIEACMIPICASRKLCHKISNQF